MLYCEWLCFRCLEWTCFLRKHASPHTTKAQHMRSNNWASRVRTCRQDNVDLHTQTQQRTSGANRRAQKIHCTVRYGFNAKVQTNLLYQKHCLLHGETRQIKLPHGRTLKETATIFDQNNNCTLLIERISYPIQFPPNEPSTSMHVTLCLQITTSSQFVCAWSLAWRATTPPHLFHSSWQHNHKAPNNI